MIDQGRPGSYELKALYSAFVWLVFGCYHSIGWQGIGRKGLRVLWERKKLTTVDRPAVFAYFFSFENSRPSSMNSDDLLILLDY